MKCPICKNEMENGGIFAESLHVYWYEEREFKKNFLELKRRRNGVPIGKNNYLGSTTKIDNVYFCKKCNKAMGIFDIEQDYWRKNER
ncbi:PF20097 family protein [Anaerosphaera multitolerans]|uniref:DUF6487 domain-containing protein n=1 Tax=Anaerosphaera multitolerans TaxID=2487351 RepID=A0A437S930_9FIRM|nr:PF20097 family protein [Anaerosphaera multitolerans]RVU55364.1 hypothetical protein EF514_03580 [Anaerosphaera multitolerans]